MKRVASVALALAVVIANAAQMSAQSCPALPADPRTSGIDHVVFVMIENRSFDHFLGWLPNSDGRQSGLTYSGQPTYPATSTSWPQGPYRSPAGDGNDPVHQYGNLRTSLNGGLNDGWLNANPSSNFAISYYLEDSNLNFMRTNARAYTTLDRSFGSILSGTLPNRMFAHAAVTTGTDNWTVTPYTGTTIWDRLASAQPPVSARYYVGTWGANYIDQLFGTGRYPNYSCCGSGTAFANDLAGPNFPSVAFVDPAGLPPSDDHPGKDPNTGVFYDIRDGDNWLNQVVSAITSSQYWPSTAIVITFDENGGFFDHVQPPRATAPLTSGYVDTDTDANGRVLLGFRVPTIVISPFSAGSSTSPRVNHLPFDHTGILKLIEWRWQLNSLTLRDGSSDVNNLACVLNFWQGNDIGAVGTPGSWSRSADGSQYTVRGAGPTGTWGTADEFYFLSQPFTGDGQIIAHVASVQNTNSHAKAGIMIRESRDPSAASVIFDLQPSLGWEFMERPSTGAPTYVVQSGPELAPQWLKLVRSGSRVLAYMSSDGLSWILKGTTTLNIAASAYIGLAVTSSDSVTNPPVLNTSVFDNVSVTNPWVDQDIGTVGPSGSVTFNNGTYTINGAGPTGTWGAADNFHFFWQPLSGDGQVIAKVTQLQNTNQFAKAGVMVRETLDPGSAHVIFDIKPDTGLEFMKRPTTGAQTSFLAGGSQPMPAWLKLTRSGSTLTAYVSGTGNSNDWATIGTTDLSIATNAYIGLIVESVSNGLNESKFDNVSVGPIDPPPGPNPPGTPGNPNPSNGATGVTTTPTLTWSATNATSYDVSFGTSNPPPTASTNQASASYSPGTLTNSTTYFWKIVARNGTGTTAGPVWSFTTAGSSGNIVIYASEIPSGAVHGMWSSTSDSTSPNGIKLTTPNNGWSSLNAPIAAPADYVDVTFTANAGIAYTLWLRLQAVSTPDAPKWNDAIWVQFSDALVNGSPAYQLNTTNGLLVNLATDSTGNSDQGWGWVNGAYWLPQGATVTFANSGTHTLRIQVREDGVQFDQIVLSPSMYFNSSASCPNTCGGAPGPVTNDHTIVPK